MSNIMLELSWQDFEVAVDKLARWLEPIANGRAIYGPPRGGLCLAVALSHRLGIPLVTTITGSIQNLIWVDDIVDSGTTLKRARENLVGKSVRYCAWINKQEPDDVLYVLDGTDQWVVFPWEDHTKAKQDKAEYDTRK